MIILGFIVPPLSKMDLLRYARKIREIFHVDTLFFPIIDIIEFMSNSNLFEFNLHIALDSDMPNMYAYWDPGDKTMYVRESVYIGAYNRNGRDRFTLVHELVHFFVHDLRSVQFARSDVRHPIYCDSEWQANTCASYILMEPQSIQNMSIDDIVSQCGVSWEAANIAKSKKLA